MAPSCRSLLWASTARLVVVEVMIWRLRVFSLQLAWLEDLATAVNAATLWARYWKNSRILNLHFWFNYTFFWFSRNFLFFLCWHFDEVSWITERESRWNLIFDRKCCKVRVELLNLCSVQQLFNFLAKDEKEWSKTRLQNLRSFFHSNFRMSFFKKKA